MACPLRGEWPSLVEVCPEALQSRKGTWHRLPLDTGQRPEPASVRGMSAGQISSITLSALIIRGDGTAGGFCAVLRSWFDPLTTHGEAIRSLPEQPAGLHTPRRPIS